MEDLLVAPYHQTLGGVMSAQRLLESSPQFQPILKNRLAQVCTDHSVHSFQSLGEVAGMDTHLPLHWKRLPCVHGTRYLV